MSCRERSLPSLRNLRCHVSVKTDGSLSLRCSCSSNFHSPPSSHASSQEGHTSRRLATVPLSRYLVMMRSHFGQRSALVVSAGTSESSDGALVSASCGGLWFSAQ